MDTRNKIYVYLDVDERFINKAKYVFRTFGQILNIDMRFIKNDVYNNIQIYYGKKIDSYYPINIYHNPQAVEFFHTKNTYLTKDVNFVKKAGEYIPFLFSQKGAIFHHFTEKFAIRKDIISSAFYFLSCWDEYTKKDEIDLENRFSIKDSLQFKMNFLDFPVVDRYCEILDLALTSVFPEQKQSRRWESSANFVLSLSHDVDYFPYWNEEHYQKVFAYNKSRLAEKGLLAKLKAVYKIIGHYFNQKIFKTEKRKLKKLIDRERRLGVNSTFFLLASESFSDSRQRYCYDEQRFSSLLQIIEKNDLGFHGSQLSGYDEDVFRKELACLQKRFSVNKYRTHYLTFNYHKSFQILEKNNIEVDCSLGFWEQVGYRAGTSYPFRPFDVENDRVYNILEIPLIMMDTSLFSPKAMNLSSKKAWQLILKMIENATKHHSHLSLLWHPTTFDVIDYAGFGNLYFKTINYVTKKKGLVLSLEEFKEKWLMRINELENEGEEK